jgi:hypothetical protein
MAVFEFADSAFGGRPLRSQEQIDAIYKTHGKLQVLSSQLPIEFASFSAGDVLAASGSLLLESANALSMERTAAAAKVKLPKVKAAGSASVSEAPRVSPVASSTSAIMAAQKETKNSHGRRQIAPVLQKYCPQILGRDFLTLPLP